MLNQKTTTIKFPKNLGNEIVTLYHNNTVDVFWGTDGWNEHARFSMRKTAKGVFLSPITPSKVPAYVFKHLINEVN